MAMDVWDRHGTRFESESIAFELRSRRTTPSAAAPPPFGRSASAEAPRAVPQERSTEQVAIWIRALLRLQPALRLAHLAEELGLSDRQFGQALGLLIRRGKARVRKAPGGLCVTRVETAR
jgi:hypothetical protein